MCVAQTGDIALVTLIFKPLPPTLKMITGLLVLFHIYFDQLPLLKFR